MLCPSLRVAFTSPSGSSLSALRSPFASHPHLRQARNPTRDSIKLLEVSKLFSLELRPLNLLGLGVWAESLPPSRKELVSAQPLCPQNWSDSLKPL